MLKEAAISGADAEGSGHTEGADAEGSGHTEGADAEGSGHAINQERSGITNRIEIRLYTAMGV
jgi:hypothetical protein